MALKNNAKWRAVLTFWFEQCSPQDWFSGDAAFDARLHQKFSMSVQSALGGWFDGWQEKPNPRLALILLLDQLTRNLYRGTPNAFAGDAKVLQLAQLVIAEGQLDNEPDENKRMFILMPLMHSEEIDIHRHAAPFFETYTSANTIASAIKHQDAIARFGRYPHRNEILGRPSTDAELEYLKSPETLF